MRRIFAALLCAALLFPATVAPTAAIPIDKPTVELTAPTVGEGHCSSGTPLIQHLGWRRNPTTFTNVRGIRSLIFDRLDLDHCQPGSGPPDVVHGPAYWVALIPGPGNAEYGNINAIIQIGVINCEHPTYTVCDGTPNYFYAGGGCGLSRPIPQDLGPAPAGGITFAVRHVGDGEYWLTAQPNVGPLKDLYIDDSSSGVNCWAFGDGPIAGMVSCERWDAGDNCGGNTSADKVDFTTIRYQVSVGGQWYIPGLGNPHGISVSCNVDTVGAEGFCSATSEAFKTWVVQQ